MLWRVESSAWYAKLKLWQEKWIHLEVLGARGGHETLHSAWPAQARIEESILRGQDRCAATLDYSKFFDMFDSDFYMDMLTGMRYPKALAEVQRDMYTRLIRHIKVAGSFGDELAPTCGMGQGCSLTLIAANATVTIEFLMLDKSPQPSTNDPS